MRYLWKIWRHPRETIREIVERDPSYWVYPLAIAFWAGNGGFKIFEWFGPYLSSITPIKALSIYLGFAVFCGPLILFVNAVPIRWACNWLGGSGSLQKIKATLAWSSVPFIPLLAAIVGIVLLGPTIGLLDLNLLAQETTAVYGKWEVVYSLFHIFHFVMALWSAVIAVSGISETEEISVWRAIVAYVLAVIIVFALAFAVGFSLSWFFGIGPTGSI